MSSHTFINNIFIFEEKKCSFIFAESCIYVSWTFKELRPLVLMIAYVEMFIEAFILVINNKATESIEF